MTLLWGASGGCGESVSASGDEPSGASGDEITENDAASEADEDAGASGNEPAGAPGDKSEGVLKVDEGDAGNEGDYGGAGDDSESRLSDTGGHPHAPVSALRVELGTAQPRLEQAHLTIATAGTELAGALRLASCS